MSDDRTEAQRLERILACGRIGLWEWVVGQPGVTVSSPVLEMLGLQGDGRDGHVTIAEWSAVVHPDDRISARARVEELAAGRLERASFDFRLVPGGCTRWVRSCGQVVARGAGGAVQQIAGTLVDVTEHRRTSEALATSEARHRTLLETMMDGLVVVDMEGHLVDFNEAYRAMLGHSAEELRAMDYRQLTPERWHAVEARIVAEQVLPLGYSEVYEKEYRRRDGSIFPVELRTLLVRDANGPSGMWAIVRDISARKKAEEALHRSEARFRVASRLAAMGTLVAGIAHEINNPLAASLANQGMALETVRAVRDAIRARAPLDPDGKLAELEEVVAALTDAQESGKRIAQIVRDMTVFANPDPSRRRISLADVVRGAMQRLPPSLARTVTIQQADGAPDVMASPGQLEKVVHNLIANAARATAAGEAGGLVVRTGPGSPGLARLEVTDQGAGIPVTDVERIFDPFFTTHRAGDGRGAGLGLAIGHAIVTAHGGTISVESEVGKGSTFRLELPAAPAEGEALAPAPARAPGLVPPVPPGANS